MRETLTRARTAYRTQYIDMHMGSFGCMHRKHTRIHSHGCAALARTPCTYELPPFRFVHEKSNWRMGNANERNNTPKYHNHHRLNRSSGEICTKFSSHPPFVRSFVCKHLDLFREEWSTGCRGEFIRILNFLQLCTRRCWDNDYAPFRAM